MLSHAPEQKQPILLVGTGPMAAEYANVLRTIGLDFVVASRTAAKAAEFAEAVGAAGGVALGSLASPSGRYEMAIVATAVESLASVAETLITGGIKAILLEKPGALSPAESGRLAARADAEGALLRVAYNRRYYASVRHLRRVLADEEPVCAFFDFTEWAFKIAALQKGPGVKERWAIGNSAHVIDTVAYLLGPFEALAPIVHGAGELDWHPSGATFVGMGRCGRTPVSWCTSWVSPGRWNIEVMTRAGRYKLSPMERLQVMRPGSVDWREVEVDYVLDERFKPGLHQMVVEFRHHALEPGEGACALPGGEENAALLAAVLDIVGYAS